MKNLILTFCAMTILLSACKKDPPPKVYTDQCVLAGLWDGKIQFMTCSNGLVTFRDNVYNAGAYMSVTYTINPNQILSATRIEHCVCNGDTIIFNP